MSSLGFFVCRKMYGKTKNKKSMMRTDIIPSMAPQADFMEKVRRMNCVPTLIEDAVVITEETAMEEEVNPHPNFIESNTSGITLEELERNCIVPSFGDNQLTISHQNFIHRVEEAARDSFPLNSFGNTEIRVSHKILGRVPGALNKRKEELLPEDETVYYQRMAFCFHIRSMSRMMNGQEVHLCIGGVRSLNEENLYRGKSPEKFKVFIGWRVRVCSNLMLTCDGLVGRMEVLSESEIYETALRLFLEFNPESNLKLLGNLSNTLISQEQFCQIIGRLRLYQVLPPTRLKELPKVILGDSNINAATRGYIENPNFGLCGREHITCWDLMQLLNEAAKQSYIDKFLERNQNCTDFAIGIQKALNGEDTENYSWFLS